MILAVSQWWGGLLALSSFLFYVVAVFAHRRMAPDMLRLMLFAGWFLHGLVLAEGLLGNPPRFGFAPALSMTMWLVLAVYAVQSRLFPQMRSHWALAGLGAAAVVLVTIFPGSSYLKVASIWLPLHWALGIASYGLFAAAVVHGGMMQRTERAMREATQSDAGLPLMTLERLTFRFVEAGFVLLSATLLVGWLFSEQLYGAGLSWKWNHKTIFSVLAWVVFAGLLIGRAKLGWRGLRAVRLLYVGCGLLLLGYVGSRFVMEVVLDRV